MSDYIKALVRLEGEVNRDWELTKKDNTVEKYYSIEGSARYGFGNNSDGYVWEHDQKMDKFLDKLSYAVTAEEDVVTIFEIDLSTGKLIDLRFEEIR